MLSCKMLCHVALLFLIWPCIRGSRGTKLHTAVFDQEAVASENIPKNYGFLRNPSTKTPVSDKPMRQPDATTEHFGNSNSFIPITPQSRQYDHEHGSVNFVKVNTTDAELKQFLEVEGPDEDPVYSAEARIFLSLARQAPNRRSFEAGADPNEFELLKVTKDTPSVANYRDFYDNLQNNKNRETERDLVTEQPQRDSRKFDREKQLKSKRRDRGKKMENYMTNYGMNSGESKQNTMDSVNQYYSYSSLRESQRNGHPSVNDDEENADDNIPIQDVINYHIQKESEPHHKVQSIFKPTGETSDNPKNRLNSHSVHEVSENMRNRYRIPKPVNIQEQRGTHFNEKSDHHPKQKAPKQPVKILSSDSTHGSQKNEFNARKELPKSDFIYEALFNREDNLPDKYDVKEEAKDSSEESFEYQEATEKPKRTRKLKKRPKNTNVPRRLPKEHREEHQEISDTVHIKKGRINPASKFHNHNTQSNVWAVQDVDESKEDDSDQRNYDTTDEESTSSGTKQHKFHNNRLQLSNSWSHVSPNVEVSHSRGVAINQIEKPKLIVPFEVKYVPIANFDHNTALGNSQGFDFSNAVLHNSVTAAPVLSTVSPILNTQNIGKTSKNNQNQNLRYVTVTPDTIVGQSTFQNPVQAVLVPQQNIQNQNKFVETSSPQYFHSTVSPVYISPVTASPNLQNANIHVNHQNVPEQNIQGVTFPRNPLFESGQNYNPSFVNPNGNQQQTGQSNPNNVIPHPTQQTFQIFAQNSAQPAANHHVQVNSNGLQGQHLVHNEHLFTPPNVVSTSVTSYPNQSPNVNLQASSTERNPVHAAANQLVQVNSNGLPGQNLVLNENFYAPSNVISIPVTPFSNQASNVNVPASAVQRNPIQASSNHHGYSNGLLGQNLGLNANFYTASNSVSTPTVPYTNQASNINSHAPLTQRNPVQPGTNHDVQLHPNNLQGQHLVFNQNLYAPHNIPPSDTSLHTSETQNNGNIYPGSNGQFLQASNNYEVNDNIKKLFYNQNLAQSQNILQNIRPQLHSNFPQAFNYENLTPRTKELIRHAQRSPTVLATGNNANNVNYSHKNLQSSGLHEQNIQSPIAITQRYKDQNQQILRAANDIFENTLSQLKQLQKNQSIKSNKLTYQSNRGTDNTVSHSNLNPINVSSLNFGKLSQPHLPNLGTRNVEIINPSIKPSPVDFTPIDLFANLNNYAPSFYTTPIPIFTTAGFQMNSQPTSAPTVETVSLQNYLDSLTGIGTKGENPKTPLLSDQKLTSHDLNPQGTLYNPINFIPNLELVKNQAILNSKPNSKEPSLLQNLNLVPAIPGGSFYKNPFFAEKDLITKPKLSADLQKYAEEMFKESLKTIYNSQKWNQDTKVQLALQPQNTSDIIGLPKIRDGLNNFKFLLPGIQKSKELLEAHYSEIDSKVIEPQKLVDQRLKPASTLRAPSHDELEELFRQDFRIQSPVSTKPIHIHHTKDNFDSIGSAIVDSNRPSSGVGQHSGIPQYLDDFLTPPRPSTFLPKNPFNELNSKRRPGSSFGNAFGSSNERPFKRPTTGSFKPRPGGVDASASNNIDLSTYFNNPRHESSQNKHQFQHDNHDYGQDYQGLPSDFRDNNYHNRHPPIATTQSISDFRDDHFHNRHPPIATTQSISDFRDDHFHNRHPSIATTQSITDDYSSPYKDLRAPHPQQFDINHPRMHNLLGLLRKNKKLPSRDLQNYFHDKEELKQHFENEKHQLQAQFYGEAFRDFNKKSDNSSVLNLNTNLISNNTNSQIGSA